MTTKKILSILICLVMLMSLMPMAAWATEVPESNTLTVVLSSTSAEYDGERHKPAIGVYCGTRQLTSAEYTLGYTKNGVDTKDFVNAGTITITAYGAGVFQGISGSAVFTIIEPEIAPTAQQQETQQQETQQQESQQQESQQETTQPSNDLTDIPTQIDDPPAGDPPAGDTTKQFTVTINPATRVFDGNGLKPSVTVYDGNTLLTEGKDYTVEFSREGRPDTSDFKNVGTVSVTVKGMGDYSSLVPVTKEYTITAATATQIQITVTGVKSSYAHTGSAITPEPTVAYNDNGQTVTLVKDSHYKVAYSDNVNVGEATITIKPINGGLFSFDEATVKFNITDAPTTAQEALTITAASQSINYGSKIDTTLYSVTSGSLPTNATLSVTLTPSISTVGTGSIAASNAVIKDANGTDITANYAISYVNGALTIDPKPVTTPKIVLERTSYGYTGKAVTPTVTAVYDGSTLIPASEYTVAYENNVNLGTGTVKIVDNAGGNYAVSGYTTFSIVNNVKYNVVLGNGGCWYRGSYYGLGFRCDGPYEDFLGITIDGQPVDKSYYMASSGSTNVGLYPQLLKMLGNGTHYITFKYTSGSSTGVFYVGSTYINAVMTGDDSNVGLLALVMCLGVLSSVTILSVLRKKKSGAK